MIKWYCGVERFVHTSDWVSKSLLNQLKISQPIFYYKKLSLFAENTIKTFRLYFNSLNDDVLSFRNKQNRETIEFKKQNNKLNLDENLNAYQIEQLKESIEHKKKGGIKNLNLNALQKLFENVKDELGEDYFEESKLDKKLKGILDI